MKNHIKTIFSLTLICAVVAVMLAVTNSITAPIIKKQETASVNKALAEVLPGGEEFEQVDISGFKLPETVSEAYSEKNGGYVFKLITSGYASNFVIMCGVDAQGVVTGATSISSGETLGVETKYGDNLKETTIDTIENVNTVSGATKTTQAYKNAVKDALNSAVILSGGSVDIRTEEEILADNLNAALPSAEGKFSPYFVTEDLADISVVYSADNNSGFVFVYGERFVGTDSKGNVVGEIDDETKQIISSAAQKLLNTVITEISIDKYENMPSQVAKAYKTSSGNFVFELKANGYGINGDKYTKSGKHIIIKVAVSKEGKIICCQTISQAESEGFGDACADQKFYSQFNGKTEKTVDDIDAISGATITTNGYKTAVSKVFEAVRILKGETL